ncbi:HlyD family efflux transporter periplasmic adaptor subunit [bacterium]|nr:HlyD family efflux transporter periplasmic adaptor subunit [bacterium]
MLNISSNSSVRKLQNGKFSSLEKVERMQSSRRLIRVITGLSIALFLFFFLPWTQNIRSKGNVTTLKPNQRQQSIHSIIPGRIEKWFVQEGDNVKKGDTILYLTEVKDDYLDPDLLSNTEQQLKAKEMSVNSYMEKIKALDNQIDALALTGRLKLEQAENKLKQAYLKIKSDSMDYQAAQINFQVAEEQFKRMEKLYEDGLKSLTDLEKRKLTLQKAQAELISYENKLLTSKNEVLNAKVELTSIKSQYRDEVAKSESQKYTALSNMYDAEAVVTKLQNQYMNYSVRSGLYYVTAPQDGYIIRTVQSGIGETIKEGEEILTIMPASYDLAIAMYVQPIDIPLLEIGQHVRTQFDGWPAIVFSGWPNVSYGTYGGTVYAIDNYISDNGMYRVLVAPDTNDVPWPKALRVGAGSTSMLLLKDVPIWYELWRKINGFPPDYYKINDNGNKEKSAATDEK